MRVITFLLITVMVTVTSATVLAGRDFRLPRPEKIEIKNGLKVFYLKDSELPLVNFQLSIKGVGSAYDPSEFEGLSDLMCKLILKGNRQMNAEAIAEELDFMGADLDISANDEFVTMRGECLSVHLPKLLEIAYESLASPIFDKGEFFKERDKKIERIKIVKDNARAAVFQYFKKAYFGTHPMSNLQIGTEASLKNIKLETLKKIYREKFRPDLATLSIVGDVESGKMKELLGKTFAKWNKPSVPASSFTMPRFPKINGKKLLLVNKPDATQSYFVFGYDGFEKGNKVTSEARVINTLLGGRFTSWLNSELRIKRGLTYGARSRFDSWKDGGWFIAYSYTKNDQIGQMLDITFSLLKKARNKGFSKMEITSAKNYLLGRFPPTLETIASKASAYTALDFYGFGLDYHSNLLEKIRKVSQGEANKTAAAILPIDNFVLVIVGKADEIRALISKYGKFEEKKISEPGF